MREAERWKLFRRIGKFLRSYRPPKRGATTAESRIPSPVSRVKSVTPCTQVCCARRAPQCLRWLVFVVKLQLRSLPVECVCVCDRTATSPYRTYLTVILVPPKPAVVATVTPQRFGYAGGVFAVELVLVAPVLLPLCGNKKSNQFLLRFVLRRWNMHLYYFFTWLFVDVPICGEIGLEIRVYRWVVHGEKTNEHDVFLGEDRVGYGAAKLLLHAV